MVILEIHPPYFVSLPALAAALATFSAALSATIFALTPTLAASTLAACRASRAEAWRAERNCVEVSERAAVRAAIIVRAW